MGRIFFACKRRFKSYYVVWKLYKIIYRGENIATFKSYYVVWKLIFGFFAMKRASAV